LFHLNQRSLSTGITLVEFVLVAVNEVGSSAGSWFDEIVTMAPRAIVLRRFVLLSPMPRTEKPKRRHSPMQISSATGLWRFNPAFDSTTKATQERTSKAIAAGEFPRRKKRI